MMINRGRQLSSDMLTLIISRTVSTALGLRTVGAILPPTRVAGNEESLYGRLSSLTLTGTTVSQTLNQYIREGKFANKFELDRCIRELRKYRRYQHALEIMEWMDKRDINLSHRDHAVRLDLISKTKGISAAEHYFSGLSPSAKNLFTHGALLNCYCVETLEEKALVLFGKMDEMNFVSSLSFNNLMSLYMRLDRPEKVPVLVQQMKSRNMPLGTFTYNVWMQSLWHLNDIAGVERVFEEITRDNVELCNWTTYSNLASVYVEAGLHEKAESALQMLQSKMGSPNRLAFHFLITLYARISNLDQVHRTWKILKSSFHTTTNSSYLTILQALGKLNAIDGLTECFEEWESVCSSYDMRLANTAIGAYLRHEKVTEAESVFQRALTRSLGPFFNACEMFIVFSIKQKKMDLAMKWMEEAASGANNNSRAWLPRMELLDDFFKCFIENKDVESGEKLFLNLKKVNCIDNRVYCLLLQTYVASGKQESSMRQRIEGDGVEISPELESLLNEVCP